MIRHFFKLVWNRRRANSLILIELLISFLVLCGVLAVVVNYFDHWRQPLGFKYDRVWVLGTEREPFSMLDDEDKLAMKAIDAQLYQRLRGMPEVESLSPTDYNIPFTQSRSCYRTFVEGSSRLVDISRVAPEMHDVLRFDLVAGRWLQAGDEALDWMPIVITRNYARAMFGTEDPIGRPLDRRREDGTPREPDEDEPEPRIVGVIADYHRFGELLPADFAEFRPIRSDLDDVEIDPPDVYLLRVREGVTAAFEEELLAAAHDIAPNWTFLVTTLDHARQGILKQYLTPLAIVGTIAGFLLIMVGLGLAGVLWQGVTRRTQELGLRRALGATGVMVRWQVLGELLALASLAMGIGAVIFLQAPILRLFDAVGFHVYLIALALGAMSIYLFVILCGLYPSWLATRIRPVEALQYE